MPDKILFANGIKFNQHRALNIDEAPKLLKKLIFARNIYSWHRRLALITFYLCIFAISLALLVPFFSKLNNSDTWIFPFMFCALLPAIVGIMQEVFFGVKIWVRALFIFPIAYIIFGVAFPTLLVNNNEMSVIPILFIFIGWAMIMLRWFDAKKSLQLVSLGIKDVKAGSVNSFTGFDAEGIKISLEVFPESQLIYKFQNKLMGKWEAADVTKVSNTPPHEYLAPWYYAPTESLPEGIKYFQRRMSKPELSELKDIRKKFLHKAWVSILPCIYFSASGVNFFENLTSWNINPSLSLYGWVLALILGMIFPVKSYLYWNKLGKDLEIQKIVSVWFVNPSDSENELLEEFLQESSLLWSQSSRPSYWRLVTKY